jgi:HEAT repeat protein
MLAIAVCALTFGIAPVAFRSGYKLWWTWVVVQDVERGQFRFSPEGYATAGPRALQALREAVRSGAKKTRLDAMQTLGMIGQDLSPKYRKLAKPAVPDLIEALTDEDEEIRIWAAITLGHIGSNAASAVEPLIGLVQDEAHPVVVPNAITALGEIGPPAIRALPVLAPMVNDPEHRNHVMAIQAFWRIGPKGLGEASLVIPKLIDRLQTTKSSHERAWVAGVLGGMGSAAREAIPALSMAAEDPEQQVSSAASNALRALAGTETNPESDVPTNPGIP